MADGVIHMRHPVFEIAVLELPAIQWGQWGRWHGQHNAAGRIVVTVLPWPAAAAVRVGAIGRPDHVT
jgi:hypothetical protein